MDTLPSWLLKTINSHKYGGRTVRIDEHTVVLYDYGTWTEAHSRAVKTKYPECDISVTESQASLSGFIVVFKLQRDRSLYSWLSAIAAMFVLLLVTVRQVLSTPLRPFH
jgi:hypothetical protein